MVNLSLDNEFLSSQARSFEWDLSSDESFDMGLIFFSLIGLHEEEESSVLGRFALAASVCSPIKIIRLYKSFKIKSLNFRFLSFTFR